MMFVFPITIYNNEEDIELARGKKLTREDFDDLDDFLDYTNKITSKTEIIKHQSEMILNVNMIESIRPAFRVEATEEDQNSGNFDKTLITLSSGEEYSCNWTIKEIQQELQKQGIAINYSK